MDKKINIAICLSTEPRFWENAVQSISKFIDQASLGPIKVDVFYHFWDDVTCQYPAKPRDVKLTDEPMIKNINADELQYNFKPTVGICESKDKLDPHIDEAWKYIQLVAQKHNVKDESIMKHILQSSSEELKASNMNIKEGFYAAIKRTSRMKFSQIMSMCKSLILMTDYAEENNIHYDIIIRSRSDIYLKQIKYGKLEALVRRDQLSRYIYFTELSVRTPDEKSPNCYTPHAVFDFFITSSNIINKDTFKDYTKKINELMFVPRKQKITQRSIHNCVPLFLKQGKTDVALGSKITPFSWNFAKATAVNDKRIKHT